MATADATSYLEGLDFPARHGEMMRHARSNDASSDVIARLKGMDDGTYQSMEEVEQALQEGTDAKAEREG